MKREEGFTLIELLVVLVIVSIVLAIAVMAFGDFGKARRAKSQLQQFSQAIQVAKQQAIIQQNVLGVLVTAKGYRFYQYNKTWQTLSHDRLSQESGFAGETNVRLQLKNANIKHKIKTPQIMIQTDGTVTPFVLLMGKQ